MSELRSCETPSVIRKPYLLFLGDAQDQLAAKTACGVAQWRAEWCVGQLRLPGCRADVGLDDITLDRGMQLGAATLEWTPALQSASRSSGRERVLLAGPMLTAAPGA